MQTGTPVVAPLGYECLDEGQTYYFWREVAATRKVLLVEFPNGKFPTGNCREIDREAFATGLDEGFIQEASTSESLPPHLRDEDCDRSHLEDLSYYAQSPTNNDIMESRLIAIRGILDIEQQLLVARNPDKLINGCAKRSGHNASRVRLWVYSYLLFGRNTWTLMPRTIANGRWKRGIEINGPAYGCNPNSDTRRLPQTVIDLMFDGYRENKKDGKFLTAIYKDTLRKQFKCVAPMVDGQRKIVSTLDLPVPTLAQFRYHVIDRVGLVALQRQRLGPQRHRRTHARHQGTFTSAVNELMEVAESDSFVCKWRPRGYIDGSPLLPINVVRLRDVASGMLVGVGFSYGSEVGEAYKMARFIAALPKSYAMDLWDITVEADESEWPSKGLPLREVTDRGPGSKRVPTKVTFEDLENSLSFVQHELTPSGMPSSKAGIESSNPRTTHLEGPKSVEVTDLTPYELVKRILRMTIAQNSKSGGCARMTPEMINEGILPNPISIWNWHKSKGRYCGEELTITQAVKKFLTKVSINVSKKGFELDGQRYSTKDEVGIKFLDSCGNSGIRKKTGYVMRFCVRYIWVEINGEILKLCADLSSFDDQEMLFRSFDQLKESKKKLAQLDNLRKNEGLATEIDQENKFEEETGKTLGKPYEHLPSGARRSKTRETADHKDLKMDYFKS